MAQFSGAQGMAPKNKAFLVIILGLMSAIGPLSTDMYLPGFPAIAKDLGTTVAHIGLSLSTFFIGISAGQFIYGPLLDRFGRKKPVFIGMFLYIASSAGCAMANTAEALIVLRFFQALGGCAGMVASRAIVRDTFPVEENAKVFSMLMLVIGVSPIIAPTLGGFVSTHAGWHYVFWILTGLAMLIVTLIWYFLPQGRQADKSISLKPVAITKNFVLVLKQPQFYTYAFTGALASSGLYAYITGSPYVFMQLYHVTEQHYGLIFAGIAIGLIVSSQVNSLLLRRFRSQQIIVVALCCQALTGILLVSGTWLDMLGLGGTIALIAVFLITQGCTFPNSSALALAPFTRNAGSASALMGGIQMSVGALSSAAVSAFSNGTAIPMTAVMAGCSILSLSILLTGRRVIAYKERKDDVAEEAVEMIL